MSKFLTWVLRLLPVVGAVLFLVGVGAFGALPSWWDPMGFIVNLASGLTAACFGIPLAFFVLQDLVRKRESADSRHQLGVDASTTVVRLVKQVEDDLLFGLRTTIDTDQLSDQIKVLRTPLRELVTRFDTEPVPPPLSKVLDVGDQVAVRNDLTDKLEYPSVYVQVRRARALLDLLSNDINKRLTAQGWNALHANDLEVVAEYLEWREAYDSSDEDPTPVAFERLQKFKRRDWPTLRQEIEKKQLDEDGRGAIMSNRDRNGLAEPLYAATRAEQDLERVKRVQRSLESLRAEGERLGRRPH